MNTNNNSSHKLFVKSKKAIAVSAAILTLIGASAVSASDGVIKSLNNNQTTPAFFKAAVASNAIPGQYIVVLKDELIDLQVSSLSGQSLSVLSTASVMDIRSQAVMNTANDLMSSNNGKLMNRFHAALSGFVAKIDEKAMKAMLNDKRIAYIEQDQMMHANVTQNNATWGIDRVDQANLPLDGSYTYDNTGSGVSAYIVDTGVLSSHSDFGGRVGSGYTAINDGNGTDDCNGHGTHVAGTVGSTTYGLAKNVSLIPVRVLGCNGSGSNSGVIAGVDWVAQNASGPSVANMSLGGGNSTALDNAVNGAINAGITFVVAAGNNNGNACSGSPNRVPAALTIASSTSSDARSSFSNYGSCIDLFAPGSDIKSTWSNGSTNTISGTSMAAPHVAGAVALYLQSNPSASPSQVESAIEGDAIANKISNVNGSPNLLLQVISGSTPPPPPPPTGDTLENNVAVTGISLSAGSDIIYTMEVPANATDISFVMNGGSGDADMYVKFGSTPTDSSYDCRPWRNGNNETCTGSSTGGTYYVRVKAYSNFSGVSLTGSYTPPGGSGATPPIDSTVDDIAIESQAWSRYSIDLVDGYSTMTVSISGGSGDADLYVNFGSQSSTSSYDCRPYINGNSEACTFNNPEAGTWHVDIRGYSAVSGLTLNVTAN